MKVGFLHESSIKYHIKELIMTSEIKGTPIQQVNSFLISQFKIDEIYKKNAFRLLQIPTLSTDREITRRKQILEISRKTQAPIPDGPCKIFPIVPDENHLDINNLVDSLRDPVRRFYQEFFWFWPLSIEKNSTDPGLLALSNGFIDRAREIWAGNYSDPRDYAISLHNLAVLNHFMVLDNNFIREQNAPPNWKEVYKVWGDLSVLTDFWSIQQEKIREVNDPRLTYENVNKLRQSALSIIAFTNAQEAIRLAEKDRFEDAKNLMSNIQDTPVEIPINKIQKLAVDENREKVLTIINLVKQKAKNDPAHCEKTIESLLKESNKQIRIIKVISTEATNELKTLRNEVVEVALNAIEAYMIATDDSQRSIELVKTLKLMPITKKIDEKVDSLLESYTEFSKNHNYWHCSGYFDDGIPSELFEELEKAREAFNQQDYEVSITLLEAILVSYSDDQILKKKAIHPPLAFTLSRQAQDLAGRGLSILGTPRTTINKIFENIRNKDQRCILSLVAVKSNQIQDYSRRNMLYCCSCLSTIYGTFYTGEKDGLKYLVCERCYLNDRTELDTIRKKGLPFFFQARDLLTRANLLQPSNLVVATGLSTVYDILEDVYEIPKPKPKTEEAIHKPSPPKISTTPIKPTQNVEPIQKIGCLATALIGILAMIFFIKTMVGNNLTTNPSFSPSTPSLTHRPTIVSTKAPTKKPTSIPIIAPTSSCRSWNTIKASDNGKYVCATGVIQDAYWGSNQQVFYLTFSDKSTTLRLEILGGYYFENIVGDCVIVEGIVHLIEGVPIIQVIVESNGKTSNLYDC